MKGTLFDFLRDSKKAVRRAFNIIFRSYSRYSFQSFVPKPGTKGFPLLSGLGLLRSLYCRYPLKGAACP
jgi:hypothetical protein